MSVRLDELRIGSRVKLRGSKSTDPRKPWPRGWKEVVETDIANSPSFSFIRVVGEERWLPVELIEEVVNG